MMTSLNRSESQISTFHCSGDMLYATDSCMGGVDEGGVFGLDDAQVIHPPYTILRFPVSTVRDLCRHREDGRSLSQHASTNDVGI